jgi:hypothetical protein
MRSRAVGTLTLFTETLSHLLNDVVPERNTPR